MRTLHLWRVFLGISSVILLLNMGLIDWLWFKDRVRLNDTMERVNQLTTAFGGLQPAEEMAEDEQALVEEITGNRTCGSVCERVIEKKVVEMMEASGSGTTSVGTTPRSNTSTITNTTTVVSKAGTYYIPLSGTGSTTSRDWVDIPSTEIVVDWSEYGSNYTVTWDAYSKVHQGNGKTLIRLYDKTNAVEVPGSNLETGSENTVHLVSSVLTLWAGKNTYVVQVKSLTGYQAFFESGRIKVIVK